MGSDMMHPYITSIKRSRPNVHREYWAEIHVPTVGKMKGINLVGREKSSLCGRVLGDVDRS